MMTKLTFADVPTFATPLLAAMAVDIATGADNPLPTLLVMADEIGDAAARFLSTGEFKAKAGETLLLHAPAGCRADRPPK